MIDITGYGNVNMIFPTVNSLSIKQTIGLHWLLNNHRGQNQGEKNHGGNYYER